MSACGVDSFSHEALFYGDDRAYVDGSVSFIREGLAAGEGVLVAALPRRLGLIRAALGEDAGNVQLADMTELGHNPAVIIGVWKEYLDSHRAGGRSVRGIGEPIYADRSADELVECHRHEALLNLAFDAGEPWRLMCPYDTKGLAPEIVADARRTHPWVWEDGVLSRSAAYRDPHDALDHFDHELADLGEPMDTLRFTSTELRVVRRIVAGAARDAGLSDERSQDVLLAVTEIAANSVRHGGGCGDLFVWARPGRLTCEVRDCGYIDDPLAGRFRAKPTEVSGRGIWIAHQLCDLVEIRTRPSGTVARLTIQAESLPQASE